MLVEARIVKQIDERTKIVYVLTKGNFPVAPRDFCLIVASRIGMDGNYYQITRSVVHPEVPEVNGIVRAEMLTSGFAIRPCVSNNGLMIMEDFDSSTVKFDSSFVTYVIQFDPKGWIPTFIANKVAEYQPLRISTIRNILQRERQIRIAELQGRDLSIQFDVTLNRRGR